MMYLLAAECEQTITINVFGALCVAYSLSQVCGIVERRASKWKGN
jgi:hypothetical protein